jgi:hypothetical protein
MPEINSRWILFLPYLTPKSGFFETFEGNIGRIRYSPKILDEVLDEIGRTHPTESMSEERRKKAKILIESWADSGDLGRKLR